MNDEWDTIFQILPWALQFSNGQRQELSPVSRTNSITENTNK